MGYTNTQKDVDLIVSLAKDLCLTGEYNIGYITEHVQSVYPELKKEYIKKLILKGLNKAMVN